MTLLPFAGDDTGSLTSPFCLHTCLKEVLWNQPHVYIFDIAQRSWSRQPTQGFCQVEIHKVVRHYNGYKIMNPRTLFND